MVGKRYSVHDYKNYQIGIKNYQIGIIIADGSIDGSAGSGT